MGFTPLLRCALLLAAGLIGLSVGGGLLRQRLLFPRDPIVMESYVFAPESEGGVQVVSKVAKPDGPIGPLLLFGAGVLLTWLGYRAKDDAMISRAEPYEGSWSDRRRKALENSNTSERGE